MDLNLQVVLNDFTMFIPGIVQYGAVIELPSNFFGNEQRKRRDEHYSQQINNLINQVSEFTLL